METMMMSMIIGIVSFQCKLVKIVHLLQVIAFIPIISENIIMTQMTDAYLHFLLLLLTWIARWMIPSQHY